ncbi:MAG: hypothetical protein H7Y20_06860 [Bryobacteraceae bacterium]|nr:hypothetical protein [Bryobacteraceae bacterium]
MSSSLCNYFWRDHSVVAPYRTAVSLHSHTQHSEESLGFIPRYSLKIPLLRGLVQKQERRFLEVHGKALDFNDAWWTPPLSPREAYDLERTQIETDLGLRAFVSLSDHDNIEAPTHLHVLSELSEVPISVEWTVPFGPSFFHLGIHNLPAANAQSTMRVFEDYTAKPEESKLADILAALAEFPSVLVVLNHPMWDEPGIGAEAHRSLLNRFTVAYRPWLHALELNGLRSWKENAEVTTYATHVGIPLISGGDRHGCEPNANVNLTNAESFDEFVYEVRNEQRSHVLFLNQFREPVRLRLMQGVLDVVRDYPELSVGRRRWTDRVFFRNCDGNVNALSALWEGDGPSVVQWFMVAVRLLESPRLRGALRIALAERQEGVT